jgi:YVTN family beta-propeller protein
MVGRDLISENRKQPTLDSSDLPGPDSQGSAQHAHSRIAALAKGENMRKALYVPLLLGLFCIGGCDRAPERQDVTQDAVAVDPGAQGQVDVQWPAAGDLLYVSNEDSGNISIISTATNQLVKTLDVGRRPRGIKVNHEGDKVYVALSGSPKCPPSMPDAECASLAADKSKDGIAVVDVRTARLEKVLPGGSDPEQFDLSSDGRRLFVSNEDSNQATIVDIASGEILQTVDVGREPEGIRVSPDGKLVYVTGETDHDVTVLNADTGELIATIEVGLRPRDAVFSSDGLHAYVSSELGHSISVIDVREHIVKGSIDLGESARPVGMVVRADDKRLYVANGRGQTVSEIDTDSLEVLRSVEVGPRAWGITLGSDERLLYTANGPSDDITVVDVESMTVVARVQVGETPWGLAVGPNPGRLP